MDGQNILYAVTYKNALNAKTNIVVDGSCFYTITPDLTFTLDDQSTTIDPRSARASGAAVQSAQSVVSASASSNASLTVGWSEPPPAAIVFMELLYVNASRRMCSRNVVLQNPDEALEKALKEAQDFDNGIYGFRVGQRPVKTTKKGRSSYGRPKFEPRVYFGNAESVAAALINTPNSDQLKDLERAGIEYVVSALVAGTKIYSPLHPENKVYTHKGKEINWKL